MHEPERTTLVRLTRLEIRYLFDLVAERKHPLARGLEFKLKHIATDPQFNKDLADALEGVRGGDPGPVAEEDDVHSERA
jgi:hypothetical protein